MSKDEILAEVDIITDLAQRILDEVTTLAASAVEDDSQTGPV